MAQKKISQLLEATTLILSSDLLPIVNEGSTKKVTLSAFFASIDPQTTLDAGVRDLSAVWQDSSTVVQTNSAAWAIDISIDTGVRDLSATWQDSSTVVQNTSGNLESSFTFVVNNSAKYDDVSTIVQTNSASWAIDTSIDTEVRDLSAKWEDSSTIVQTNSAAWAIDSTIDAGVRDLSAKWEDTSTNVQSASANWIFDGGNSKGAEIVIGTNDEHALSFETNNSTRVVIASSGKVGINESSPEAKLHVSDGSAGSVTAPTSSVSVFESAGNAYVSLLSPNSHYAGVVMGGPTNPYGSYVSWNHDNLSLKVGTNHTGASIQVLAGTEQEALRIASTGNVGVGTTSPSEKLTVFGNISASGNYKFGSTSSAPSDTVTPVAWVEVFVGTTAYKMPLYQ
jgi:hypothetical protein